MNPIKTAKQLLIAAAITATTAHAQEVTVPNTFEAGTAARASEVNDNFSALADSINALATRLDAIEASANQSLIEKLSGRIFEVRVIQAELFGDSQNSNTATAITQGYGSITLNEDGTYEYYRYFETGDLPIVQGGDNSARDIGVWANGDDTDGDNFGDGETESGTWTVTANNSLQLNRAPDSIPAAYYFRLTPSGEMFASQEYFGASSDQLRNNYRTMLFVGVLLSESQQ